MEKTTMKRAKARNGKPLHESAQAGISAANRLMGEKTVAGVAVSMKKDALSFQCSLQCMRYLLEHRGDWHAWRLSAYAQDYKGRDKPALDRLRDIFYKKYQMEMDAASKLCEDYSCAVERWDFKSALELRPELKGRAAKANELALRIIAISFELTPDRYPPSGSRWV